MKRFILSALLFSFLTLQSTESHKETPQEDTWVTILVHGIMSIKPHLNVSNVVKLVRDKIANTPYARSIEQTRRDPYFYQHHPVQGVGLRKIDESSHIPGAAASACAQLLSQLEHFSDYTHKNRYYTFGWSGLLSPRMRYFEAKIFYVQLLKEFEPLLNQKNVKFRIISYSHGGNVALRLAEVYKREGYPKEKKIRIDELILIGVPILPETDYLVHSSIFKKIYHFYSFGDRVQRLDFFSLDRVFSNRKFRERSDFLLPDKLVQINLKIKRLANPKKNLHKQCYQSLYTLLHNRTQIRNADPGHTELWSFGWSPSSYRKSFPLYPLPFAIFTPYIIHQIQLTMPKAKHLMVELHPHYEHMILYNYTHKTEQILPFLQTTQLVQLKNHAETFRPLDYDKKIFNAKINETIKTARKERFDEGKNRRLQRYNTKLIGIDNTPQT